MLNKYSKKLSGYEKGRNAIMSGDLDRLKKSIRKFDSFATINDLVVHATAKNRPDMVEFLIKERNGNALANNNQALEIAISNGFKEIETLLEEHTPVLKPEIMIALKKVIKAYDSMAYVIHTGNLTTKSRTALIKNAGHAEIDALAAVYSFDGVVSRNVERISQAKTSLEEAFTLYSRREVFFCIQKALSPGVMVERRSLAIRALKFSPEVTEVLTFESNKRKSDKLILDSLLEQNTEEAIFIAEKYGNHDALDKLLKTTNTESLRISSALDQQSVVEDDDSQNIKPE